MRVAYWDLETWDLSPQFGAVLCASVLDSSAGKMKSFRIDDYVKAGKAEDLQDDRALLVDVRDHLETFHITAGWFSKGFDIALLRTRLVMHGERPLKEHLHFDGIWYFRGWRGLKPMSSKMKHVAEFFGAEKKPDVTPETWMKAKAGNKKAMNEVVDRCEADVRITADLCQRAIDLGFAKTIQRY